MKQYISTTFTKFIQSKFFIKFRTFLVYFSFIYLIIKLFVFIKTLIELLIILIFYPEDFIPHVINLIKKIFN
jgi:hypothetical protein